MKLKIKESSNPSNSVNTINQNIINALNEIENNSDQIEFNVIQVDDGYIEVKAINTETANSCSYAMDIYKGEINVACDWSSRIRKFSDIEDFRDWIENDIVDNLLPFDIEESYEKVPLMTIRNQLMKKLGDDYKATGGSMNPKVLISYLEDPRIEFEIEPDGKNLSIVTKHNKIPDTLHKKKGISLMRAGNILYDYITKTVNDFEKGEK